MCAGGRGWGRGCGWAGRRSARISYFLGVVGVVGRNSMSANPFFYYCLGGLCRIFFRQVDRPSSHPSPFPRRAGCAARASSDLAVFGGVGRVASSSCGLGRGGWTPPIHPFLLTIRIEAAAAARATFGEGAKRVLSVCPVPRLEWNGSICPIRPRGGALEGVAGARGRGPSGPAGRRGAHYM